MSRSVIPLAQVDAFTGRPFAGNPAAVCLLPEARPDAWLQDVAREMNLSETAFLVRLDDGFDLRWFTPEAEVDLCGHATLASAHALWESGRVERGEPVRFHTRSGLLTCVEGGPSGPDAGEGWIWMDFPAEAPEALAPMPEDLAEALADALGAAPRSLGRNRLDLLVEVGSDEELRALRPDLEALRATGSRGVIVTAAAAGEAEHDFVSRYFAPGVGVPEDPVTGSAHCCLGPFWAERLGRRELVGHQASRRGGTVRVVVAGERVKLGGQAVTVMTAELLV
ncbi:MAG: PhzF family phenazine biosynthesis protein [Thermoanaerobaculia bacterium]